MMSLQVSMEFKLFPHQEEALKKLQVGKILYGDVGSGKTFTGLAFYLKNYSKKDLIVITTAKKRDEGDWDNEAATIGVNELTVDSWNNIKKYTDRKDSFFIFDEQRVVGYQAWSKAFIKICKNNQWILLSGTPGDTWSDYIPVFIANGMYKNKTDFINQHVEYDRFVKYPKIKKYHNEGKLIRNRANVLVHMKIDRHTTRVRKYVNTDYDENRYKVIQEQRWNPDENAPIKNASELTQMLRKTVAIHATREWYAKFIMDIHDRIIVFYNYNYELEILLKICNELDKDFKQWNGSKHEQVPMSNRWTYLVQYTAGSEGWNCITTDTMMFFSLNYSYKIMEQAEGRIDRLNTPYTTLEYFNLTSKSKIDKAVRQAIEKKKKFNESAWGRRLM